MADFSSELSSSSSSSSLPPMAPDTPPGPSPSSPESTTVGASAAVNFGADEEAASAEPPAVPVEAVEVGKKVEEPCGERAKEFLR